MSRSGHTGPMIFDRGPEFPEGARYPSPLTVTTEVARKALSDVSRTTNARGAFVPPVQARLRALRAESQVPWMGNREAALLRAACLIEEAMLAAGVEVDNDPYIGTEEANRAYRRHVDGGVALIEAADEPETAMRRWHCEAVGALTGPGSPCRESENGPRWKRPRTPQQAMWGAWLTERLWYQVQYRVAMRLFSARISEEEQRESECLDLEESP